MIKMEPMAVERHVDNKTVDIGRINAKLNYRHNPDYITFAQFEVSTDFISRLLTK